jgi:ribosomal protein S25
MMHKIVKMPHAAVHKSKEKKRKGAGGAENEYARRLQNLDENLDVPIGRITKMLRADRFLVSFYDIDKKQTIEVQAGVVDRNVERLKPNVGSYVVPVESGSKYEIYLVLSDEDARRRSERIPKNILNVSFTGTANQNDDLGIEFVEEEVEDPFAAKPTGEDKKDKKDKGPKHVERVVREENDRDNEEVNIDDI